jgi:hypothetical protein
MLSELCAAARHGVRPGQLRGSGSCVPSSDHALSKFCVCVGGGGGGAEGGWSACVGYDVQVHKHALSTSAVEQTL